MIKLIIADDEPKIRRGLVDALDWNELDIEVVGVAANGAETLCLTHELSPDLCLLDINMPILNGLDLIDKLRAIDDHMVFIIITGYDEFDYARRAVQLGVFDYILKPVVDEVLRTTVERAVEFIRARDRNQEEYEMARQMLLRNMPLLRERFLIEFVGGKLSAQEIQEHSAFHGVVIRSTPALAAVRIEEDLLFQAKNTEWNRQLHRFAVRNVFEEMLGRCGTAFCATDEHENFFAIVDVRDIRAFQALKDDLKSLVERELSCKVRVYIKIATMCEALPEAYEQILDEMNKSSSPIIALAQRVIDRNYMRNDFSLSNLAEELKISEGHLSRLFKQETGQTFVELLTRVRIQEAIALLNDPNMRIVEIAERVGYNTQHYFCATFKRTLGISPTEFRQRNR